MCLMCDGTVGLPCSTWSPDGGVVVEARDVQLIELMRGYPLQPGGCCEMHGRRYRYVVYEHDAMLMPVEE